MADQLGNRCRCAGHQPAAVDNEAPLVLIIRWHLKARGGNLGAHDSVASLKLVQVNLVALEPSDEDNGCLDKSLDEPQLWYDV